MEKETALGNWTNQVKPHMQDLETVLNWANLTPEPKYFCQFYYNCQDCPIAFLVILQTKH